MQLPCPMVFVGFGHRDKLADAGVHWERGIRVFIPNSCLNARQKSHGYCQMARLGLAEVK